MWQCFFPGFFITCELPWNPFFLNWHPKTESYPVLIVIWLNNNCACLSLTLTIQDKDVLITIIIDFVTLFIKNYSWISELSVRMICVQRHGFINICGFSIWYNNTIARGMRSLWHLISRSLPQNIMVMGELIFWHISILIFNNNLEKRLFYPHWTYRIRMSLKLRSETSQTQASQVWHKNWWVSMICRSHWIMTKTTISLTRHKEAVPVVR